MTFAGVPALRKQPEIADEWVAPTDVEQVRPAVHSGGPEGGGVIGNGR